MTNNESTPRTSGNPTGSPAGAPAPTVWTSLRSQQAPALLDWLVDVLGFERRFVARDGDTIHHAQLMWPEGGGVMLGSVNPDSPWDIEPGKAGLYVVTGDPEAVCARVNAAGGRIVEDIHDTDYGNHEFSCVDPDGNHWSFGTYRGEPASQ